MPASDVEMVRDGFETLAREGVEGMLPLIHPEFEMTTPPGLAAEPDTYRGREGMRRYWDSFGDGMEGIEFLAHGFEDLGEGRVLNTAILRGKGRSTGIEVSQKVILVWEVRDAMAYRIHVFASEAAARAAFPGK